MLCKDNFYPDLSESDFYLYIPNLFKKVFKPSFLVQQQGRKRPLDTPKRMIERREREGER